MADNFKVLSDGKEAAHTEELKEDGTTDLKFTGLKPNSNITYDVYYVTGGDPEKAEFSTKDTKPGAPTVQVTADDTKLFVKIVSGTNTGSAIKSGKIYYTDGTTAKTMDLKPGDAGTISGLTNGTEYQVQATVTNGAGESPKSVVVKGTPKAPVVKVTGVSLDKTTLSLETGKTGTLKANVAPTNATDKGVAWKSSDETIATVDGSGKVMAIKAGEADITATTHDGNKAVSAHLTVVDPAPETPPEGE